MLWSQQTDTTAYVQYSACDKETLTTEQTDKYMYRINRILNKLNVYAYIAAVR